MYINGNFKEVIFDKFEDLFELLTRGLPEKFLAKEICYLVHHEFMKRTVLWAQKLLKQIIDKFRARISSLIILRRFVHFFVDFSLEQLKATFVFGKKLGFLDEELSSLFRCL